MNKLIEYGKKLLTPFIVFVLLFALNINTFATGGVYSFYDYDFVAFATLNGTSTNVTSHVKKNVPIFTADNGRNVTRYTYDMTTVTASYMSINTGVQLDLYTVTEYEYNFQFRLSESEHTAYVNITLFIDDSADSGDTIVQLFNSSNVSANDWVTVSGKFKTPDIVGSAQYVVLVQIGDEDGGGSHLVYSNMIDLSDFYINPIGPLYGKPIETPDSSELEDTLDEYEDVMSQLPTIDGNELDNLMNFDFSSFTDGLAFVRDMFNRTMSVFGFNAVLVFALTIGLATYIIGRKVG